MMFGQLSTMLTLLSALFVAHLVYAADFDWDIKPRQGYPSVSFNGLVHTEDIIFQYDAPLLYEDKTYRVTVLDDDCKTIGSDAITHLEDASVDRELTVLVNVDQGVISDSPYYRQVNMTAAVIGLCLRVEYLLGEVSVNFHETNLTIDIDLTSVFKLSGIKQSEIEYE
jgi:hypothetical protein